jgi:hypothetical protein
VMFAAHNYMISIVEMHQYNIYAEDIFTEEERDKLAWISQT